MVALTPRGPTSLEDQLGSPEQFRDNMHGALSSPSPVPRTAALSGAPSASPMLVNPSQPQGPALSPTAPPAGAEQAPASAAPTPEQPDGQPDISDEEGAKMAQEIVDQSAERAKAAPAEAKKKIGDFSFDFEKAYEEWEEKFGGRVTVPDIKSKEEKALFLMDFGFRMMHASSQWQQSPAGAMGASMIGAKAAQQQRVDSARSQNMEVAKSALGAASTQEQMHTRALDLNRGQLLTTDDGYFARMPDNSLVPLIGPDGKIAMPTDHQQKQYAAQWHYDMLIQGGYDHRQAVDILNGAATPAELNAASAKYALSAWDKFVDGVPGGMSGSMIPPGGKERKRLADWTPEERQQWQENAKKEAQALFTEGVFSSQSGATGGSLPPPGALPPPGGDPQNSEERFAGKIQGRSSEAPIQPKYITGPDGQPTMADDEFSKIPSGAYFVGPDGVTRRKP